VAGGAASPASSGAAAGGDERGHREDRRARRRLLLTLLLAVVLPAGFLAIGTLSALRQDAVVLARLREERLSLAARAVVEALESESRERARAALAPGIRAAEEGARADGALLALASGLEAERERGGLIRDWVVLDARGRVLAPRLGNGPLARGGGAAGAAAGSGGGTGAAGDAGESLREAVLRFERRQALERRLVAARRLEARGAGLEEAREAYREIAADAEHPDLAARARLDLARALAREGEVDAALEALDVLGRLGPEIRTEGGLAVAPAARLRAGELRIENGRLEEGAARLLDLVGDVVEGAVPLPEDEARFVLSRARAALAPVLPRVEAPAYGTTLARLLAQAARRERQAAFARDLAARTLPDLAPAIDALGPGETRLATLGGDAPRLFALAAPALEAPLERLAVVAEVDLAALARDAAAPLLARLADERQVALAVVDRRGRAIAAWGALDGLEGVTVPCEEVLPFWRVRAVPAARDPEAGMARWRIFLLSGLVALMLVAIGAGALLASRAVERSLALARLKSEFVAHVSHELRTPLTSIRMFAELLRSGRAKTEEKRRDYLERIEAESARLQRLIDDLLDFARLEAGRKEYRFAPGDAGEVAEEAVAAVGAQLLEAGFAVDLDVLRPLPAVRLDRESLRAALENLLSNARKYAADRRRVTVRVASRPPAVEIEVADEGIGIDEAELPRLFEKFFRGRDAAELNVPGSGLGLALVKRVVEDHGGTIAVRSRKGEGTAFTIALPALGG
jgi:signal transduction histidine kinase